MNISHWILHFFLPFSSTHSIRFIQTGTRTSVSFLLSLILSLFSIFILFFLFSFSSPMAIWKIDSRTVTHSAQRDPGWEMSVTGRRARIRLEIGSPVQRTMKQWDCYVRGRKGEEPRALERSPFICKCIGETSDCFKKILSRIIRGN